MKELSILDNRELQGKIFEAISDFHLLVTETNSMEQFPYQNGISDDEQRKRLNKAKENRPEKTQPPAATSGVCT